MLRISKLTDYATLIMSHLARDERLLWNASQLADALGLNKPTVSKLLKLLSKAELVTSMRGALGGYRLTRSSEQIHLSEVVHAIEGQVALTMCCEGAKQCRIDKTCTVKENWRTINTIMSQFLGKFTLKDMLSPIPFLDVADKPQYDGGDVNTVVT